MSPILAQYTQFKGAFNQPKMLLLYRVGDFFELFFNDAIIAASLLNITLTSRPSNHDGDRAPMAGFQYRNLDNYLRTLEQSGFSYAVCDQDRAGSPHRITRIYNHF